MSGARALTRDELEKLSDHELDQTLKELEQRSLQQDKQFADKVAAINTSHSHVENVKYNTAQLRKILGQNQAVGQPCGTGHASSQEDDVVRKN